MLPSREARNLPITKIAPPLVVPFEMRVIVYGTRDIQPYDGDPDTKTDMFFRVWLSTLPPKETDTHLRCADGRGSFNWRFKFELELPLKSEGLRELHVQCWDLGFPHNNLVGDALLELTPAYRRAFKFAQHDLPFALFDPDADNADLKSREDAADAEDEKRMAKLVQRGDGDADDSDDDDDDDDDGLHDDHHDDDDEEEEEEDDATTAGADAPDAAIPLEGVDAVADAGGGAAPGIDVVADAGGGADAATTQPSSEDSEDAVVAAAAAAASTPPPPPPPAAKMKMKKKGKKKAGADPLGLTDPPDALWVPLQARGSPRHAIAVEAYIRIPSEPPPHPSPLPSAT